MYMEETKKFELIKKVPDKYFDFIKELGIYSYGYPSELIPRAMLDKYKRADGEGYSFWLPIQSTVTDNYFLFTLFKH